MDLQQLMAQYVDAEGNIALRPVSPRDAARMLVVEGEGLRDAGVRDPRAGRPRAAGAGRWEPAAGAGPGRPGSAPRRRPDRGTAPR